MTKVPAPTPEHSAAREVAPCLFCGKEQDADSFHYNGPGPPPSYAVECGWCGARGSCRTGSFRDDHEGARRAAVKDWNDAYAAAERRGAEGEREAIAKIARAVADEAMRKRQTNDTEPYGLDYVQGEEDAADSIESAIRARTEGEGEPDA